MPVQYAVARTESAGAANATTSARGNETTRGRNHATDVRKRRRFDRKASDIDYYYASRLPGESADGVNDIHFHPVEPRSARLTLQHSF